MPLLTAPALPRTPAPRRPLSRRRPRSRAVRARLAPLSPVSLLTLLTPFTLLLAMLGPVLGPPPAASAPPAGSPAGPAPAASPWVAPLPLPLGIVRAFEPPAHPYGPGHRGVDLAAGPGSPIRAAGAGTVRYAGELAGRPVVSIEHPGGLRTTYEPVIAAVRRGERIGTGQVIGHLTARGAHCRCLHWGLVTGTGYRDPLTLLGGRPVLRPV